MANVKSSSAVKELAKWEVDFLNAMKKSGGNEAKEILADIEKELQATSQESQMDASQEEEMKEQRQNKAKELEKRIEYSEEKKKVTEIETQIKFIDKKIKESEELLKQIPTDANSKEFKKTHETKIKELKKELKPLEKELEPLRLIVNGLQRKLRTFVNRIERSVNVNFGSIIKHYREVRGYSLKDIESMTGISPSYINRIEKGQRKAPSYRIIEQLSKALEIPIHKLIAVAEAPETKEVPSLEELLLTSQFTVNGKRATKQSKEKLVEFIKKFQETSSDPTKKYEEYVKLFGYFDYFKDAFSNKK